MKQLYLPKTEPMRLACFLSGSGTNVKKIIERQLKLGEKAPFKVAFIFSDSKSSNASSIAAEHLIPFFCNDIKEYYAKKGASRKDMNVRKEFDAETKKHLEYHKIDVVALCGYMSIITNEISDNFTTVNVHPADLRVKGANGKRLYAGKMGIPSVKAAILNGDRSLRSTVHLVNTALDEGPILMVSAPVRTKIKCYEKTDELLLESAAAHNMEVLKEKGDWMIYPEVIEMLAKGRFEIENNIIFVDGKKYDEGYCPSDEKEAIREIIKEKRNLVSNKEVQEKSSEIVEKLFSLPEFQTAKTVMFYWALPNEVQSNDAIKAAKEMGKKVVMPIMRQGQISVRYFTGFENLRPGPHGLLEPVGDDSVKERIDLIIVPGLAFDNKGARIGFGMGCYDSFLRLTNGKKAGLCFDFQLFDVLPKESKDIPMDFVVTETKVVRVEKD
jgi:5,10-methenyltetrahydrofolate synthetase